jgi:hypothetical protein
MAPENIHWGQLSDRAKALGNELWLAEWRTDETGRTVAWASGASEQEALNALAVKCPDYYAAIRLAAKNNI